jgi:DNA polymerase-4
MNVNQAKRHCPNLILVPPRMAAYSEASDAVMDVFRDTTPLVEPLSIDEAFLDVTGLGRVSGSDTAIASQLKARVAGELGLPISVGGGSTKFLAKVASAVSKPDGLLVVPAGEELAFLHPLPVGRLWGVGPVTEQKLAAVGINTVGDVAALELEILQAKVGKAAGAHVHALARNADPRPVEVGRRRKSIGAQRSFPATSVAPEDRVAILVDLADRVARRVRHSEQLGRTVQLSIRYGDFGSATRSRTLPDPTDATEVILRTAKQLLVETDREIEQRGLTKLGISVANLESADAVQLGLPFDDGNAQEDPDQWRPVDGALDQIRSRFGTGAVTRATLLGVDDVEMPKLPD